MARVPLRILMCDCRESQYSGEEGSINLSDDTVFNFLSEEFIEGTAKNKDDHLSEEEEEEEEEEKKDDHFWETQHQLLQSIIRRTSSLESRIRNITKETRKEAQTQTCGCRRPLGNGCRKCLMEKLVFQLQKAGFDSAICNTKWRSSPQIPSGEHSFLDVIDNSNPKKGQVRVIVELNFRAQFEMARANEEYNNLIKRVPEVFVGKIERLCELLKIVCAAGKKCMKDKKMHMAPWRKHRYMQAKWLATCDRLSSLPNPNPKPNLCSDRPHHRRPRVSMLTADLHRSVAQVV